MSYVTLKKPIKKDASVLEEWISFQETYLERKAVQNLCLAAVAMATETFQNGLQIEFNRDYIANKFGDPQFFFSWKVYIIDALSIEKF